MSHHDHQHQGGDHHHHAQSKRALHKHWLTWVVVGLMLAAMLMYVLSDDESLQPDGKSGPPVEAAP